MFKAYTCDTINEYGQLIGSRAVKIWFFENAKTAYDLLNDSINYNVGMINFRRVK